LPVANSTRKRRHPFNQRNRSQNTKVLTPNNNRNKKPLKTDYVFNGEVSLLAPHIPSDQFRECISLLPLVV
jgi:hypothetical protein